MIFRNQATAYMVAQAARKRLPVSQNTLDSYQSALQAHILPQLGDLPLDTIRNGELKRFTAYLVSEGYSPATIRRDLAVVKQVVKSAVDSEGNELYPRTWNEEFIDAPVVNPAEQKAPLLPLETLLEAISGGSKQEQAFYALLAGSGLRLGEAIALRQGVDDGSATFWDRANGRIHVRTQIQEGRETAPKTDAGIRTVDLDPGLNAFLTTTLPATAGLVFRNERQGFLNPKTLYKDASSRGITLGFHSFRRFRITHLRSVSGLPEDLIKFWVGHGGKSITDRYSKLAQDAQFRQFWCAKAGIGFQLPEAQCSSNSTLG